MAISKKFILALVIVVLVGAGVWFGMTIVKGDDKSDYSAVYLTSGDIYFGKLSMFPWPKLEGVWYLQRAVDQENQPQVAVMPFKNAVWGPADEIRLNPREMLFWTSLREDSQIVKMMDGSGQIADERKDVSFESEEDVMPPATSTKR